MPVRLHQPHHHTSGIPKAAAVIIALALSLPASFGLLATARSAVSAQLAAGRSATVTSAIEPLAGYVGQVACDPVPRPGSKGLGDRLRARYPGTSYSITRACGADGMASEHYEGRAVDWFVSIRKTAQAAQARAALNWLLGSDSAGNRYANARRAGVMYLIWNNKIWGSYRASEGWRPYSNCASHPEPSADTRCHRDHIHISMSWAGAMGRTSLYSGRVAATDFGPCRPSDLNWAGPYRTVNSRPCPNYPILRAPQGASSLTTSLFRYGGASVGWRSSGPVVRTVQQALRVTADGYLGSATAAAISRYRVSHGLSAGTTVDAAMWRSLLGRGGTTPRPPVSRWDRGHVGS